MTGFKTPSCQLKSCMCLLVEGKLGVRLLDVGLVALLKVLGQDDVPWSAAGVEKCGEKGVR